MAKLTSIGSIRLSGKIGDLVFCNRGNSTYVRVWKKPKDPKSPQQKKRRNRFREAVAAWRSMAPDQKKKYVKRAKLHGRTGYNLFLSEYLSRSVGEVDTK